MWRGWFPVCALVAVVAVQLHADDSPVRELNHDLHGKIFLLRNFYRGDRLRYNAAGEVLGNPPTGSWTVDGAVEISKINLAHNHLQIHTKRCFLGSSPDGYELARSERGLTMEIDVDGQPITVDSLHSLMHHLFLTSQDRAADFVPAFWKPCFGAQTTGSTACRISPRLAPLFRFAAPLQVASAPAADKQANDNHAIFGVGKGVSPPHAIHAPDPEYSVEARKEGVEGMVIIGLVVDKFGQPTDVKIVSPVGYGLDENAIKSVRTWKFEPARKGGEPVPVYATVEVAFHLR
jgi:TonB family protein